MAKAGDLVREILQILGNFEQAARVAPLSNRYRLTRAIIGSMLAPRYSSRELSLALSRLKFRGLLQEEGGEVRLTPKGLDRISEYQLDALAITSPEAWDGVWRLVSWEIPESQRSRRDLLRSTLARLGFRQLQRSLWVLPYPCREQVEYLRDQLNLKGKLTFIEAHYVEGEAGLRHHFGVSLPQEP